MVATVEAQEYRVRLPVPHAGQRVVLAALSRPDIRFAWLDAGRRWFKTSLEMVWAVDGALCGEEVLWGAPVFDQARTGFEYTRYACRSHPLITFTETRMEARFPGGGIIRWRSLDNPDNARSKTAHRAILDEAADIPSAAWYEVIRPILMTTQGKALIAGTPKGRNWFWREFMRAKAGDAPQAIAWDVPTVGARLDEDGRLIREPHPMENPLVPWDEIVAMHETMPERAFRQEVLGEFLEDAGGVFRGVRACIDGSLKLYDAPPSELYARYCIGVDLAKSEDYTVAVVVDVDKRTVVGFDRWNKADWGLTKARLAQLAKTWRDATVWLDSTGLGSPIYDDLRRAGVQVHAYTFTAASKQALIDNAVLTVEQKQVRYPDVPSLIAELEAYEYIRTPSGNLRMSAPEGMHDDCVVAFALACWPLARQNGRIPDTARDLLMAKMTTSEVRGGADLLKRVW